MLQPVRRLDDARLAAEVVVPDVVEDLGLGQDAVRVEHEVTQQLELGRRHLDDAAAAADLVGVVVELEVVEGERRRAREPRPAGVSRPRGR